MMQELIDTLHNEQCSLVILHDGHIRTFEGHGMRKLYNIASDEPELLYNAKLAAKAVGHSAASTMVDGGVAEVYADYISQQAYDALKEAGIVVNYDRKFNHSDFLDVWRKLGELQEESVKYAV